MDRDRARERDRDGSGSRRNGNETNKRGVPRKEMERKKNDWIFSQTEVFQRSPSIVKGGLSPKHEMIQRAKGINFIIQVGTSVRVPEMTINAACTFLHRFYIRHSLKDYHCYEIGGTCLFLATKAEESLRRLRDVAVACTRTAHKDPKMVVDEQSRDYWRWRERIVHLEEVLLETLCFDVNLESPYAFLNWFINQYDMKHENLSFCKAAWGFVNDSCRTSLCLLYEAKTIAAAGLFWASQATNTYPDPKHSKDKKSQWWEDLGFAKEKLIEVCNMMAELYEPLVSAIPNLECQRYRPITDGTPGITPGATPGTTPGTTPTPGPATPQFAHPTQSEPVSEPVSQGAQSESAPQPGEPEPEPTLDEPQPESLDAEGTDAEGPDAKKRKVA